MSLALRIEEAAFEGEGLFFQSKEKEFEQRGKILERTSDRPSSEARPLGDANLFTDLKDHRNDRQGQFDSAGQNTFIDQRNGIRDLVTAGGIGDQKRIENHQGVAYKNDESGAHRLRMGVLTESDEDEQQDEEPKLAGVGTEGKALKNRQSDEKQSDAREKKTGCPEEQDAPA